MEIGEMRGVRGARGGRKKGSNRASEGRARIPRQVLRSGVARR